MNKQQFRVLYREFLFRMVDLELLSAYAQGDINKLLGQFGSLLVFISLWLALGGLGGENGVAAWPIQHLLISNMMLVVGLFAVVSWDSAFPDRRDVLVLAPLPVRPSLIFLAKAAALATALCVTVAALNGLCSLTYPFSWMPRGTGLFGIIRAFAAYWLTMLATGGFVFCSVLGLQGITALLLPRRYFLRVSAFLQMAAFCLFVCIYFLEPAGLPDYPSCWFLGLLNTVNGSPDPKLVVLTKHALTGLSISVFVAASAFLLTYLHMLRKIVEEPDIVSSGRSLSWLPRFGNALQTAVVQFSIRTLLRSRQHRITLAFYLGVAFALVILFLKNPILKGNLLSLADPVLVPLLVSTFVMATFLILGTRVVFSMPLALRANWIFRITEVRPARDYFSAIRRPLFVIAVIPVCLISAAVLLPIMHLNTAIGHLLILALWNILLSYVLLRSFHKIPFACSYLPGKSYFHMAFLAGAAFLNLVVHGTVYELGALKNPASYIKMLLIFVIAGGIAVWRTVANSKDATVDFEDIPDPDVFVLGLYRDGVMPIEPSANPS
jgi:hypothetical protein